MVVCLVNEDLVAKGIFSSHSSGSESNVPSRYPFIRIIAVLILSIVQPYLPSPISNPNGR